MRVVCVIPCHERLEVSVESINLLQKHQTLQPTVIVVGWSNIERQIAKETRSYFISCENTYLGNKWQTGIDFARTLEPDALLIMGSDALISPDWVKFSAEKIANGADLTGKISWYTCGIVPKKHLEILHHKYIRSPAVDFPVGGGRMVSRKLLDRMDWQLYPRGRKSCLDHGSAMNMKIYKPKIEIFEDAEHKNMGLKGPWPVLNTFKKMKNADPLKCQPLENIPTDEVSSWLQKYFPGSKKAIRKIVPRVLFGGLRNNV